MPQRTATPGVAFANHSTMVTTASTRFFDPLIANSNASKAFPGTPAGDCDCADGDAADDGSAAKEDGSAKCGGSTGNDASGKNEGSPWGRASLHAESMVDCESIADDRSNDGRLSAFGCRFSTADSSSVVAVVKASEADRSAKLGAGAVETRVGRILDAFRSADSDPEIETEIAAAGGGGGGGVTKADNADVF